MADESVASMQATLVSAPALNPNQGRNRLALFNADGTPAIVPQKGGQLPFTVITTATAIGTAGKVVADAEPTANTLVVIKFTNGNSAATPTVAFNGGSARAIQLGGAAPTGAEMTIAANGVALFFFDGTILHQVGVVA